MDNNKMARVAKNLDILADVGRKIAVAAGIVCVVVAILTAIFGNRMLAGDAVTLDLDFIKLYLNEGEYINEDFIKSYVLAATAGSAVLCFMAWYIAGILREILAPMKNGRPFEAGISRNLRKVGWAFLAGGFLTEVVGVVSRVLTVKTYNLDNIFASSAIEKIEYIFVFDMNFVLVACIVFFLSYIFAYGQALQQDSDETL